jgi:hypothetical protein
MRILTINIMATYEDDEDFVEDCMVDIEYEGTINERHLVGELARTVNRLLTEQDDKGIANVKMADVSVSW